MELRQIRYLLALAQTLNFTRAAEQCNVTQPTLTLAIKKLEDELGGPLIHRERSRTHLTHLGRMVLPFMEQVLEASNAAQTVARDLHQAKRVPCAFGVTDAFATERLIGPLRELSKAAPGVELSAEGGADPALCASLLAGRLDIAIVDAATVDTQRLRFTELYTETMHILLPVNDPLSEHNVLGLNDVATRDFVSLVGSRADLDLTAAVTVVVPGWVSRHRSARSTEARALVVSGLGLALAGDHEPVPVALTKRPLMEPLLTRTIGIAQVRGRPASMIALTFSNLMRAQTYRPLVGPSS